MNNVKLNCVLYDGDVYYVGNRCSLPTYHETKRTLEYYSGVFDVVVSGGNVYGPSLVMGRPGSNVFDYLFSVQRGDVVVRVDFSIDPVTMTDKRPTVYVGKVCDLNLERSVPLGAGETWILDDKVYATCVQLGTDDVPDDVWSSIMGQIKQAYGFTVLLGSSCKQSVD